MIAAVIAALIVSSGADGGSCTMLPTVAGVAVTDQLSVIQQHFGVAPVTDSAGEWRTCYSGTSVAGRQALLRFWADANGSAYSVEVWESSVPRECRPAAKSTLPLDRLSLDVHLESRMTRVRELLGEPLKDVVSPGGREWRYEWRVSAGATAARDAVTFRGLVVQFREDRVSKIEVYEATEIAFDREE